MVFFPRNTNACVLESVRPQDDLAIAQDTVCASVKRTKHRVPCLGTQPMQYGRYTISDTLMPHFRHVEVVQSFVPVVVCQNCRGIQIPELGNASYAVDPSIVVCRCLLTRFPGV